MTGPKHMSCSSHCPVDIYTFFECPLGKSISNCTDSPVGIDNLDILFYLLLLSERF